LAKAAKVILVVDDHVEGIEPQLRFLEKVGYKLQIVVSASEAMGFIEVVRPGLVMLDLMTPSLAGLQFLRVLKGRRQLTGIPVIVYTTETNLKVRESALGLGASDFLIKGDVNLTQILERTNACYQETIPPAINGEIVANGQANRVVGRIYQP
jgi:CheY-like chemotaxis protein